MLLAHSSLNLEFIYPFLNAFGVLFVAITAIVMWLQIERKSRKVRL